MPRGLPDYFNPDTLVAQRLANMDELLTALRGISSVDNRGRTLYFDNFANGEHGWQNTKTGDGVVPIASTNQAEVAPSSLEMDSGTDTGGGACQSVKRFRLFNVRKAGLEFSFAYYANTPWIQAAFYYNDGTASYQGILVIDYDASKLYLYDGAVKTEVMDLPSDAGAIAWLPIKLVIDIEAGTNLRLIVGQTEIDVTGYDLKSSPTSLEGILQIQFNTDAQDDGTNIAYIGHVNVTIDEP